MRDYRHDGASRCEACGANASLEFDDEGRQICRTCAAHATVKDLSEQQHKDTRFERMVDTAEDAFEDYEKAALLRRCPTCGPTMVGREYRNVGPSSSGNVSGVTYEGKFKCTKCGRRVSIFPTRPTLMRAAFILTLLIALPFVGPGWSHFLGAASAIFGIFALADLVQRLRYPVVRR